jgi:hypothetical protein
MPTLPAELLPLTVEFAPLFSKPVWERAKTLLVGAILAVGKRTVTACLRVTGNSQDKRFQNYHRVLNRARWSALRDSQVLLRVLSGTDLYVSHALQRISSCIMPARRKDTNNRHVRCFFQLGHANSSSPSRKPPPGNDQL